MADNYGYEKDEVPQESTADKYKSKDTEADKSVENQSEDYESKVKKQQEAKRARKPLFFCRWITSYPKTFFGLTLTAHILLVVITAVLLQSGYDLMPLSFTGLPLYIPDNEDFLRALAWTERYEDSSVIQRSSPDAADGTENTRSLQADSLELFYKDTNGNVFTKENLQNMKEQEDFFFNNTEFQSKHCLLIYGDTVACKQPVSLLRFFDGTYRDVSEVFYDPEFNNIPEVLYLADTHNQTSRSFQYHKSLDAEITPTEATATLTRSRIDVGWPLEGYANISVEEEDQLEKIRTFLVNEFQDRTDNLFSNGLGDLSFFYGSIQLLQATVRRTVITDMLLAVGSLFFIVIFVLLQTGSFWVSLFAVLSVLTSFLGANLIYRVVLDYAYLGIFHVLAIFIILGIGADNIFVFFDTWKQSAHYEYNSLAHRMSDCYRKASSAMFFTTITTAMAFVVSATSPFIVISSFGVFAGVLVAFNYLSIVIYFPTVVVTYHLYWEKYKCCCCCNRNSTTAEDKPDTATTPVATKKSPVVRFFKRYYYSFMTHKVFRWFVILFFLAVIGGAIYFATQIEINEEQTKFLKDSSNFGKYLAARSDFTRSDDAHISKVFLIWGLKNQDRGSCHKTDVECTGNLVWDENFNMDSEETQQAILDLCRAIQSLPEEDIERLAIRTDINTGVPEVDCFALEMEEFLQNEGKATVGTDDAVSKYPPGSSFSYPVTQQQTAAIMQGQGNTEIYTNRDQLPQDYVKHFQTSASYWLYGGFPGQADTQLQSNHPFTTYSDLVGESRTAYTQTFKLSSGSTYYYGTDMKFMAITVNTTLVRSTLGFPKGLKVRDAWEEFLSKQKASMPAELQGGFQATPYRSGERLALWHWLKIQELLASSAVNGVIIGVCLSLPILTIATHNIIVGVLATAIICCITVSVIAMMPILGWKLGLLESLNLVLVVGLAVDYVVHLAEGYCRSSHQDRLGRTRDMLEEVGISVLSGAATTLGAAFFMLFAEILFFVQFGAFMFCTIGFSILYALALFVPVVGLIGPQGTTGSLHPLYAWVSKVCCCCCKKKNKGTSDATSAEPAA